MSTRIKLTYRRPSFLEGVSRVFDVSGVFKDDVRINLPKHYRYKSGSSTESYGVLTPPEVVGTKAINSAFGRVHKEMGIVAGRMRPAILTRGYQRKIK